MDSLKDYVNMKVTGTPWKDQQTETVDAKYSDIEVGLKGASKLDNLAKMKMRDIVIEELGRKSGKGSDAADTGGLK